MTPTPFTNFVLSKIDELKELFAHKNEQYATNDPVANFRTGALLDGGIDDYASMYLTARDYMKKHVAHIYNNGAFGPKVDESLMDVAAYCLIMLYFAEKAHKEEVAQALGANADAMAYSWLKGKDYADK